MAWLPSSVPVKVNAVFIPGLNFPQDVVPLVHFTASIGATLSVLSVLGTDSGTSQPLSTALMELLKVHFAVTGERLVKKRGVDIHLVHLSNGGRVELDDFRLPDAVAYKNGNEYLQPLSLPRRLH